MSRVGAGNLRRSLRRMRLATSFRRGNDVQVCTSGSGVMCRCARAVRAWGE